MNIMEINQSYFSEIGKLVNNSKYNKLCHRSYPYILNIDLENQHALSSIIHYLSIDGFCVIQPDHHIESKHLKLILSSILGGALVDKNPDKKYFAEVRADKGGRFYINSNLAQPMHTDEGYTTRYPRYVALHCIKQSNNGGESILVLFNSLFESLMQKFGNKVELLFKNDAITIHTVHGVETKPILLHIANDQIGISYSPVLKKMWCSEEVFLMFDYITHYVHCCDNQIRFSLKPGQILIFDNIKVLHGRSKFSHEERLLHRYWFNECTI